MAEQDVTIELEYGGGVVDHSADVLVRAGIGIIAGRADESQQSAPMTATLTFKSWRFNPRNPSSDLFGLIGRNTPLRITVGADVRFVGEVSSWTPRIDVSQHDTWVEVVASGVTRRLGQGADPLKDVMRREVELAGGLVGYWPLDDVDGSTSARAVLAGGPMRLSNLSELATFQALPAFGAGALHPWLPPGFETRENGSLEARVTGAVAGDFSVNFVYRATRASDGNTPVTTLVNALTDTPQNFQVLLNPASTPQVQVIDTDGGTLAVLNAVDSHPEIYDGLPHLFRLRVIEASGNDVSVFLDLEGEPIIAATVDIEQPSLDALAKVVLIWQAAGAGVLPIRLGQVIAWNVPTTNMVDAFRGYAGEHAGRRIQRLCAQEGVSLGTFGDLDDTIPMGPQYPDGLLMLLQECAETDGGIFGDRHKLPGVQLVTGRFLYNQDATLALDFDAPGVAPPLDPVVDDQATRNDVTVQRRDGDSFRATLDEGPLSTQAPPDGVGRYTTQVTVNVMGDGMLGDQAGWRLHIGTTDETRFPQITVDLAAAPGLVAAVALLAVGDRITIANLPADLSPDLANLQVQGWTETIGPFERKITYNCTPEEPYHIAEVEHADLGVLQSDSATLAEALDTTETGVDINCGAGPDWVHEADFDILIGGERMTVSAVAAMAGTFPARTTTLTVTRSVNGVVKAHTSGARVEFFHASYIGL